MRPLLLLLVLASCTAPIVQVNETNESFVIELNTSYFENVTESCKDCKEQAEANEEASRAHAIFTELQNELDAMSATSTQLAADLLSYKEAKTSTLKAAIVQDFNDMVEHCDTLETLLEETPQSLEAQHLAIEAVIAEPCAAAGKSLGDINNWQEMGQTGLPPYIYG